MFAIGKISDVSDKLAEVYTSRISAGAVPLAATVRGPVGIFLVRDDGAYGSELAREVVKSFAYWDDRSNHVFDGVFIGWGFDEVPVFLFDAYQRCVRELEQMLNWADGGGAYLLLTDFVYDPNTKVGTLDFSRTIDLDLTRLLKEKEKYSQLSQLVAALIAPVKDVRSKKAEVSVWEVSDYVGLLRTREFIWAQLVKKLGLLLGWADEVSPFAVHDMRRVR